MGTFLFIKIRGVIKNNHYIKFFKIFSLQSTSQGINTYASVFSNPRNISEMRFLVSPTAPVSIFILSPQS